MASGVGTEADRTLSPELRALALLLDTAQWAADVLRRDPGRVEDVGRVCETEASRARDLLLDGLADMPAVHSRPHSH